MIRQHRWFTLPLIAGMAVLALNVLAAPQQPSSPEKTSIHRDLLYLKGGDPKLNALDIYSPAGKHNCPVVIFIHGGGFQIGDKKSGAKSKGEAFPEQGYVFVSINYRLAPKVKHPVLVQDCAKAIAWIHDNVAKYGGDPNTLFVMGHSAGAQLAALVSTDERYLKAEGLSLKNLKGTVLLDGGTYDLTSAGTKKQSKDATISDAFGPDPAVWKTASPVYNVSAGKNIPPFEIIYVSFRPDSKSQSEELAQALKKANVKAEVNPAYNKTHESLNKELGNKGDVPTQQVYAFLRGITGQSVKAGEIAVTKSDTEKTAKPEAGGRARGNLKSLRSLNLTTDQKEQIQKIMAKYPGDRKNPAFRKEIEQVLTPQQRDQMKP